MCSGRYFGIASVSLPKNYWILLLIKCVSFTDSSSDIYYAWSMCRIASDSSLKLKCNLGIESFKQISQAPTDRSFFLCTAIWINIGKATCKNCKKLCKKLCLFDYFDKWTLFFYSMHRLHPQLSSLFNQIVMKMKKNSHWLVSVGSFECI